MNSIEFEILFTRPWLLLLAIPVVGLILLPYFLLPAARRKAVRKMVPTILHALAGFILVLVIAGISLVQKTNEQAIAILIDLSDSTKEVQNEIIDDANALLSEISDQTPATAVCFAEGDSYVIDWAESENSRQIINLKEKPAPDATDLSGAMEYAVSLLPGNKAKRLILFSDGKETDGDAISTARQLAANGIRVDSVCYDTTPTVKEMQLSEFSAPEKIYLGDPAVFTVEIESNYRGYATLTFTENGNTVEQKSFDIIPGSNLFNLEYTPSVGGTHCYYAELSADFDSDPKNNSAGASVTVSGQTSILLIRDNLGEARDLVELLSKNAKVDVKNAYSAPTTIVELCKYDEVVLANVDAYSLPNGFAAVLDRYVKDYGRTLITIGGGHTYMFGNMEGSAYEELLPISFEVNRSAEGKEIAMMIVVDTSLSMSMYGYMPLAKQGAIRCVESMRENDYVGIISFNAGAKVESRLVKANARNKEMLGHTVSEMQGGHGTQYTRSLQLAMTELEASNAQIKQVMFLSDGQPGDSGYTEIAEQMHKKGIMVSTIGIGFNSVSLMDLAYYGGGRYYFVDDASELPDVMQEEAGKAAINPLIVNDFSVQAGNPTDITEGIDISSLPQMQGYIASSIKDGAECYLTSDEDYPILASIRRGNGRVLSFMSDLSGVWSGEWLENENSISLIHNLFEKTVGDAMLPTALQMQTDINGKSIDITVETTGEIDDEILELTYAVNEKAGFLIMNRSKPGVYICSVPLEEHGVYHLCANQLDRSRTILDFMEKDVTVTFSKEYDAFTDPGTALLENLSALTGGKHLMGSDDAAALANDPCGELRFTKELIIPLIVLAVILLIADIAIRKLRWKDIKEFFHIH